MFSFYQFFVYFAQLILCSTSVKLYYTTIINLSDDIQILQCISIAWYAEHCNSG